MTLISIISPVYNEAEVIAKFAGQISNIFEHIPYSYELILCVDPSSDGTERVIREIHAIDPNVKLIRFSRRVGQDKATQAGIDHSIGDAVIVMDCDLQDPVELIPLLIEKWQTGYRVVSAMRTSRAHENRLKRIMANIFYRVLNSFSEVEIPRNTGDFRILDRRVVEELRKYREDSFFLRALTPVVGFESAQIEFDRGARAAGETKYNRFFGGIKAAFVALYGYTNFIQKVFLGLTLFFFMLFIILVPTMFIFITNAETSAKMFLAILLASNLGVMMLISFSGWILTSYLDRIYKQGRNRPNYTVDFKLGIE